jgi:hypothetical protein
VERIGGIGIPKKAFRPTPCNLDLDSNVTEESDPHSAKHSKPKTSTDAGRMIATNPVRKNAESLIRDNVDPDSNVTNVSDLHR